MFKYEPVKKRYTDDETYKILQFCKNKGVNTSFVDVYICSVSNLQIIKNLCELLTIKANKENRAFCLPIEFKILHKITVKDDIV